MSGRAGLLEESLALARELEDAWLMVGGPQQPGRAGVLSGRIRRAAALLAESIALARAVGEKWSLFNSLYTLALVALGRGDAGEAGAHLREGLTLCRELGYQPGVAACLQGLASVWGAQGRVRDAARLLGAGEALLQTLGRGPAPRAGRRLSADRRRPSCRAGRGRLRRRPCRRRRLAAGAGRAAGNGGRRRVMHTPSGTGSGRAAPGTKSRLSGSSLRWTDGSRRRLTKKRPLGYNSVRPAWPHLPAVPAPRGRHQKIAKTNSCIGPQPMRVETAEETKQSWEKRSLTARSLT